MPNARITDQPLGIAAANGDGTYDGRKAVRWLHEALTGNPMTESEADDLVRQAQAKATARRESR